MGSISISKHRKPYQDRDRISNLPTNLITHILSFLPTKDVLKTSILSTFWNQQWTSITNLILDNVPSTNNTITPAAEASFVNFVIRVLLLSKVAHLDAFRLRCSLDCCVKHINTWVSWAISRDVKQLELFLPRKIMGGCLLPICLFTCKSLVSLKLGEGIYLDVPMLVSLKSLKILHLNSAELFDDESLSRLVSGCSVLEELYLEENIGDLEEINITAPLLKKLILSAALSPFVSKNKYKIVLNTPKLQNLELAFTRLPDGYSMQTLDCLDNARISVKNDIFYNLEFSPIDYGVMANLILGLSNVQLLYLSTDAFQTLHRSHCKLPTFPCLTELKICGVNTEWSLLVDFLQSSPQLETLLIEEGLVDAVYLTNLWAEPMTWYPPTKVPSCMTFNLKIVEVKSFRGLPVEIKIIRYFLKKANFLKLLKIGYCPRIKEKEAEVSKKLLSLPRASKSCKIVLI